VRKESAMKRILLIDSDSENLFKLTSGLNMAGYTVIPKANAVAALSAVSTGIDVDLIVSSDRIPDIEGRDFVTVLKKMMPAVPVVLLCEEVPQQTYVRWVNGEVCDLVVKPVDMPDMLAAVKNVISRIPEGLAVHQKKGFFRSSRHGSMTRPA
jgi:DNA-binding NtrC family response regulator